MKNKAGRPPIFETVEEFEKIVEAYKVECEDSDEPFTVVGLSVFANVHKETILTLKDREGFSDSYKKVMSYAESHLVKHSLKGKYNPTVSIFLMKNNFGYKDKTEQEISGSLGLPKVGWSLED